MQHEPLILASASPRREELLSRFALPFRIVPSRYDEESLDLPPEETVLYLARCKAKEVATRETGLIIAADTIVVLDGMILGKPINQDDARFMLQHLSGRCHRVLTGLVILESPSGRVSEGIEVTSVWFRSLEEKELARYLASGEYVDKAGSYAAQGMAAAFISRIEGCYHNVIGLPLHLLDSMLRTFDLSLI